MTEEKIRENFRYHAPDDSQRRTFEDIREMLTEVAVGVAALTPDSRERSLFLTTMENAQMWANKSVAIHGPRPGTQ